MNQYIAAVTNRLQRVLPKCAVSLRTNEKGVEYLHPRKGWKRISWQRIGLVPYGAK